MEKFEKRVYLATKKNHTIGAIYCIDTNVCGKYTHVYKEGEVLHGHGDTRTSALSAVVDVLERLDESKLSTVCYFYVDRSLFDVINMETYKFWLITGKRSNGTALEEEEYNLWKKFQQLMLKKGLYVTFRNILVCKKTNVADKKLRANGFYASWCWEEINKIYGLQAPIAINE